jgi:hypothetical protein
MARLRFPAIDPSHLSKLVGVVAAMVVVVLLNVVAARRFTRWDMTANKRYSLSPATTQTLHDLPDAVQIWVLLGSADPLEQSVKQLLVAYQAETTKLDIHTIDPDRDTVALEDIRTSPTPWWSSRTASVTGSSPPPTWWRWPPPTTRR